MRQWTMPPSWKNLKTADAEFKIKSTKKVIFAYNGLACWYFYILFSTALQSNNSKNTAAFTTSS